MPNSARTSVSDVLSYRHSSNRSNDPSGGVTAFVLRSFVVDVSSVLNHPMFTG